MKIRTAVSLLLMLIVTAACAAPKTTQPSLQSQIVAQLSHPDSWVQARACYLLGEWDKSATAPALIKILNDAKRTPLVRLHAGLALGRLNHPIGKKFCADLANKRGWYKVAKAEVAQTELVIALAENVNIGATTIMKPASGNLAKSIEATQNLAVEWRDCGYIPTSDELLVLLDRNDHEAWDWLVGDFKDVKDYARATSIRSVARKLVASLDGTKVGVFAKAREKARQS